MTSDSVFLIGLLSKPITSLATLILVQGGKAKLDDPIRTLSTGQADGGELINRRQQTLQRFPIQIRQDFFRNGIDKNLWTQLGWDLHHNKL